MNQYTIYGSAISAFTRKLQCAFECYGLPYEIATKTPDNREELEHRSGTHQIPVLQTPENWLLADTTPILMLLDARFPSRRLFPTGVNGVLTHIVEEVLDEWMARTMVHFRWHYDENTVFVISKITGEIVDVQAAREQQLSRWGLRACRATGTESVTQQSYAEKEYFAIIDALETQLASTPYALGERPSAVDTILMGTFRGHTNYDPYPDMSRYRNVLEWSNRDHGAPLSTTEINAFENPSAFTQHLLDLTREQYAPFILGNRHALDNGDKAFVVKTYGEDVSYLCRPYPERSRLMIVDRIQHQLNAHDRDRVISWLTANDLLACFGPQ